MLDCREGKEFGMSIVLLFLPETMGGIAAEFATVFYIDLKGKRYL